MKIRWVVAGGVALLCHALLLFGFRVETAAVPLPASDSAVDVDLVAVAPAPEPPAQPPPPEPPPAPVPPPPSIPEPVPASEPLPVVETKPPPSRPSVHHESAKPAHPASSAAPKAVVAGAAGGVSSPVRPRSNPKPPYPPEARRLGQQGRVLLEVQVSADGRAAGVSVKRSSGFPVLDNAAVQGVQRWTFEPARVAGVPVASRAEVPVSFSLAP
ncbi:MAG: TonB family protein [Chthoniobacter sp.]|nr:TonB family protein [Chthoniobacter sp.]